VGTPTWRPRAPFSAYLRPICSLASDGSARLFFRSFDSVDDFTYDFTYQKIKEIGRKPRKLWPFESTPGHPTYIIAIRYCYHCSRVVIVVCILGGRNSILICEFPTPFRNVALCVSSTRPDIVIEYGTRVHLNYYFLTS